MIAVFGASGRLGTAFTRLLGDEALAVNRAMLDLARVGDIETWVKKRRPELIVNCAAYTDVDAAESDIEGARAINATAVEALARVTADHGIGFVTFSTDYVFDGAKATPYVESDSPRPLNVYGLTKLEGENHALTTHPGALVIRVSWLLSSTHPSFASTIIAMVERGGGRVVSDQVGRPTLVDDLAPAVITAADGGMSGLLHLTNQGEASRYQLACEIAAAAGLEPERITPTTSDDYAASARRPLNSRLDTERGIDQLSHYRVGLAELVGRLRLNR